MKKFLIVSHSWEFKTCSRGSSIWTRAPAWFWASKSSANLTVFKIEPNEALFMIRITSDYRKMTQVRTLPWQINSEGETKFQRLMVSCVMYKYPGIWNPLKFAANQFLDINYGSFENTLSFGLSAPIRIAKKGIFHLTWFWGVKVATSPSMALTTILNCLIRPK